MAGPPIGIRRGDSHGFVGRTQASPAAEGMGWVCRMRYWASPDEIGLLALRLDARFCPARSIELLVALLMPQLEIL